MPAAIKTVQIWCWSWNELFCTALISSVSMIWNCVLKSNFCGKQLFRIRNEGPEEIQILVVFLLMFNQPLEFLVLQTYHIFLITYSPVPSLYLWSPQTRSRSSILSVHARKMLGYHLQSVSYRVHFSRWSQHESLSLPPTRATRKQRTNKLGRC